ncbi:MAG: thioredoxin family protein [Alphaproteobacteria bacterium CG_4_10_14_0_2_um_filter_63_37]|nr:MAG: thioredoxin family protein [Proteobacteria bacterium CG1_02_64_396]PJA25752.1 MAG: thioredoxin family protein [Alphaproteobacteria bacterium CG_4_10_14_0_2_um_filter_63_37]
MALVESIDIPLGTPMPPFDLPDPNGNVHTLRGALGPKGLLIAFTCNHCPYAIAVWPRLVALAARGRALGIATVAINPNIHPSYPDDAPPKMKEAVARWGVDFPYLVDESQTVARAYKAQCTPDLYLLDGGGKLAYHGRIDDCWQNEAKVTRRELLAAIEAVATGQTVDLEQIPSLGCSIKWKG